MHSQSRSALSRSSERQDVCEQERIWEGFDAETRHTVKLGTVQVDCKMPLAWNREFGHKFVNPECMHAHVRRPQVKLKEKIGIARMTPISDIISKEPRESDLSADCSCPRDCILSRRLGGTT